MAEATTKESRVIIPAESADAIKQNLQQVSEELARVRDRAREEAESLERIRGMLDLKWLNELLSVIDELETRVKRVETDRGTNKLQQELDSEQARLAKLWDAFKTQEDQLKAIERERDEVISQYKTLERQWSNLGTPAKIRSQLLNLEAENKRLEADAANTQHRLEKYVGMFTAEQARLAKLYKVYQDTAAKLHTQQKKAPVKAKAAPKKASTGPFTYKGFTLYSRKGAAGKPIYFFAKKKPKSGSPSKKPAGASVTVNKKTKLPFLRLK